MVPNAGLFPDVSEVGHMERLRDQTPVEDMISMMQLSGHERASLQEAGVPETLIQRLEAFLLTLSDHQAADRGGEARWALSRVLQRAEEGLEAIENVVRILGRRLRPQGHFPIVRIPATEESTWRLFAWGRSLHQVFEL